MVPEGSIDLDMIRHKITNCTDTREPAQIRLKFKELLELFAVYNGELSATVGEIQARLQTANRPWLSFLFFTPRPLDCAACRSSLARLLCTFSELDTGLNKLRWVNDSTWFNDPIDDSDKQESMMALSADVRALCAVGRDIILARPSATRTERVESRGPTFSDTI